MTPPERLEAARKQLDLVLGFYSRVDSRLSVVLGVDFGMLALLAANAPPLAGLRKDHALLAIPLVLIGASLLQIYRAYFPNLNGGKGSLVFFKEIAERTESKFIEEFKAVTQEALLTDTLGQVWRNSQILAEKFDRLRMAFILLAWALPFWLVALALLVTDPAPVRLMRG